MFYPIKRMIKAAVWLLFCSTSSLFTQAASFVGARKPDLWPDSSSRPSRLKALMDKWDQWEISCLSEKKIAPPMLGDPSIEILNFGERLTKMDMSPLLFRQQQATIFSLVRKPEVLLKYEINCDSPNDVHPLVREAIFLTKVASLNISPEFHYLSAAVKFSLPRTAKTDVRLTDLELEKCANYPNSVVRVIAMENAGISVDDLTMTWDDGRNKRARENGFVVVSPKGLPLCDAISIARDLLEILEKLHEQGIAHGDVHPGNVAVKKVNGKFQVKLIDYGKAFFPNDPDESKHRDVKKSQPFVDIHCHYSHWNLEGEEFGFRDDLFKAMHVLAVLLMGKSFSQYCDHLAELDNKLNENFLTELKKASKKIPFSDDDMEKNYTWDFKRFYYEANSKLYQLKFKGDYFKTPAWSSPDWKGIGAEFPARDPLQGAPSGVRKLLNSAMAKARKLPDDAQFRLAAKDSNSQVLTLSEENVDIRVDLRQALALLIPTNQF